MAKDIEIRTTDGLLYKGKVNGRKYCLTIKPPPKVKKPRKKKAPLAGLPELKSFEVLPCLEFSQDGTNG